jgi:hypothetical protein
VQGVETPPTPLRRGQHRWPGRAWPVFAPGFPSRRGSPLSRRPFRTDHRRNRPPGGRAEQEAPAQPCHQAAARVGREGVRHGRGVQSADAHGPLRPQCKADDPLSHALGRDDGGTGLSVRPVYLPHEVHVYDPRELFRGGLSSKVAKSPTAARCTQVSSLPYSSRARSPTAFTCSNCEVSAGRR